MKPLCSGRNFGVARNSMQKHKNDRYTVSHRSNLDTTGITVPVIIGRNEVYDSTSSISELIVPMGVQRLWGDSWTCFEKSMMHSELPAVRILRVAYGRYPRGSSMLHTMPYMTPIPCVLNLKNHIQTVVVNTDIVVLRREHFIWCCMGWSAAGLGLLALC